MTGPKLVEVMHARMHAVRPCIADALPFAAELYHVAWIDIGQTQLAISGQGSGYILNEEILGDVQPPAVGGIQVLLNRLQVLQQITVRVCTRSAMKASNTNQAPTIPVGMQLELDLSVQVNEQGRPRLCAHVNDVHNVEAPLDPETRDALVALLQNRVNNCIPLSIAPLANVAGGETPRVFNAGIAAKSDLSLVCLRFETTTPDSGAKTRWESFHDGGFTNRLHGREWSLLIPKQMMEPAVSQVLQDNLAGNSQFSLQSAVNAVWAPWGDVPRMVVTFHGEIIDACIGIDLDVDVTIGVLFTAPTANVLRTSITLGWDGDFWEELGCLVVAAFFWPIVGIMFVDEGKINWGLYFGGLAFGPAAIFFGIVGYLSTDEPASNIPAPANWVKDSDTAWHQDQPFPDSVGGISGLSMTLAAADPEGLVLAGSITLEEPLIPALATNVHPFPGWTLSRPCHSLWETESEASIGIIAQPMGVFPRLHLPLCGVQVINDPTGFYSDWSHAGNWILSSTSLEVKVDNPPTTWVADPYDLEVLIFSNQGCRLITIPSPGLPPAASDDPEEQLQQTLAWIGWKATHCWKFISIWGIIGMMNPEWMIDPPPFERVAQHWWIQVTQAVPGDRITLRDQYGQDLMTAVVGADGRAVVSGFIEDAQARVWLARNGARLSTAEFRDFSRRIAAPGSEPAGSITIKQTLLQLQSELALDLAVEGFALDYQQGAPTLFLRTAAGVRAYSLAHEGLPAPTRVRRGLDGLRFRSLGGGLQATGAAPAAGFGPGSAPGGAVVRSAVAGPGGGGHSAPPELESPCHEPPDEPVSNSCEEPPARQVEPCPPGPAAPARPWYQGGARLGRLYVRISQDGRRVRIYRIGRSHLGFEPHPLLEEILDPGPAPGRAASAGDPGR
jgi:hypothetical protein